jgi:FMN phosphatase YigB (HAD superfamily)
MRSPALVVLDFDGTFTRVDDEARPFLAAYRRGLSELVQESVDDAWNEAVDRIESDPDRFGWEYEGRIVAPAHADPYIFAISVAQLLFAERYAINGRERRAYLDQLYSRAYREVGTSFREDARDVVDSIAARGIPVFVVTNSRTLDVERKLAQLGAASVTVRGEAKKFVLADPEKPDPRFDALPAELHIEGLARPIHTRRGHYFEALDRIWRETGVGPEETLVCGDIFELDLVVPSLLGARVHMVGRPTTPTYEQNAVRACGTFSVELAGLLSLFP